MPTQPRLHSPVLRRGSAGVTLGLALALSVTCLGATEAAASTAHNPHGTFHVTVKGASVHLWGVSGDPDGSVPTKVVFSIAGHKPVVAVAKKSNHAYARWVRLGYGKHRISAHAVNRGPGTNVALGTKVATLRNPATLNPRGTAKLVRHAKAVKFYGHAADKSVPRERVLVRLWHNGKLVKQSRTNAATKRYAIHSKLHQGMNTFRVVAVNKGAGTHNTTIKRFRVYRGYAWITKYHGNQRIAAEMLPAYGWGDSQMKALVQMWNRESGWNSRAANPSGAYGIPQSMPGSKMASAGSDWATNPRTQIKWGLGYIKSRYGSPANAWYAWQYQGSY